MKTILLLTFICFELMASIIKAPVLSIDGNTITAKIEKVDVGVSGFVVHRIAKEHTSILKNATVIAYDKEKKIATLKMSNFTALRNNSLPSGKWKIVVGDEVQLAFGYSRALLIAPSEEIYHRITKSVRIQWVHSDLFATVLSYRGHPTPLKEDFEAMSIATSVGLLFIYLDKKLYTIDIKSFKILSISDAPLTQDSVKLPFYSRVEKIEANWFGAGSNELTEYAPHYYKLLVEYNKKNENFYNVIKEGDAKLHYLLKNFEIGK